MSRHRVPRPFHKADALTQLHLALGALSSPRWLLRRGQVLTALTLALHDVELIEELKRRRRVPKPTNGEGG